MRTTFRRSATAAAVAFLVLVVAAPAARAHGLGGVGASDYLSEVTAVVRGTGTTAARPSADLVGVEWWIVGTQDYLAVTNDTDAEVVVSGYDREPYLRIGPDGVFENQRSRTTWLNRDRYASLRGLTLPADLDNDAPPRWERVSTGRTHAWFDHRAQWMDPDEDAEEVLADPTVAHDVARWEVAFTHDGQPHAVLGDLRWLPPRDAGTGLLAGLLLVGIPVAVAATRRGRPRILGVAATTLAVVVVGVVVLEVDGIAASWLVADRLEVAVAVLQLVGLVVLAAVGVRRAWTTRADAALVVLLTAVALTAVVGLPERDLLTRAVTPGVVPTVVGGVIVGASLLAILPAVLAVLVAGRTTSADAAT